MPLPEYTGILGPKRAAHLLRRATFGATLTQMQAFATLTPGQAVYDLFRQTLTDPLPPVDPATGTGWVTAGASGSNSEESDLQEFFKRWFLGLMLSSGVSGSASLAFSARERIVFFLHTHFTTIQSKVNSSRALYFQNQLYRLFALDDTFTDPLRNFKELTKKVCVDNAMLRLLDGFLNVKGSPNENYAREMFELYTIGRGLEGTLPPTSEAGDYVLYKEQDVQEAARVLSGFDFDDDFVTIDPDTDLPRGKVKGDIMNASSHDNGIKTFSNRLNSSVVSPDPTLLNTGNPTEASALEEISQLIETIYAQPETARNICRKIYRFFVYHDITENVESQVVAVMADYFTAGGYKLQPVIENVLRSQHFYEAAAGISDDNFGAIIKSPIDVVTNTLRFFEVTIPDAQTDAASLYDLTGNLIGEISHMGMQFFEPYDVAGYDAWHQYPIYHRSWISVNYLTSRYDFIQGLLSMMGSGSVQLDLIDFVRTHFSDAISSDSHSFVLEIARMLYPVQDNLTFDGAADDNSGLTAARVNYFLQAFLYSPQIDPNPEASWTDRWTMGKDPEVVRSQLQNLFNTMLQSPEYQLA